MSQIQMSQIQMSQVQMSQIQMSQVQMSQVQMRGSNDASDRFAFAGAGRQAAPERPDDGH
jgi:hypothetical protein